MPTPTCSTLRRPPRFPSVHELDTQVSSPLMGILAAPAAPATQSAGRGGHDGCGLFARET